MISVGIIRNLAFGHPWRGQTKRPSPATKGVWFDPTKSKVLVSNIFEKKNHPYLRIWSNFRKAYFSDGLLQPPTKTASTALSVTRFCTLQCRESAATGGESVLVSGAELLGGVVQWGTAEFDATRWGSWDWKFDLRGNKLVDRCKVDVEYGG